MKVAIVVLNFNGKKYIGKCLQSIQKLEKKQIEVETWVVDNASKDDSEKYLREKFSEFKLVTNSKNLGYAEGNNVGIRHALAWGADWVWVVNPDIQVKKDSLMQLIDFTKSHSRAGIVGSKVYYTPGYESHPERYAKSDLGKVLWYAGGKMDWDNVYAIHIGVDEVDHGQYNQICQTELVTGASMLVRSQMLSEVGFIDPKYHLYYEENDLCQRAKRAGWQLWYVPTSIVWHANAQSTGLGSPLVDYYTTRNRLLFGMRWAPYRSKLALLRESIRFLFSGRKWQRQGVIDFYIHRFGQGGYVN